MKNNHIARLVKPNKRGEESKLGVDNSSPSYLEKQDNCEHELNLIDEYVFSDVARQVTLTCDLCGIKFKGIVFRE